MDPQTTKRQALAHRVKRLILSGRYTGKLPSERRLAEELELSRGTINMALNELVAEGLLERRRGQGTFVPESVAEWRSGRAGHRAHARRGPGPDVLRAPVRRRRAGHWRVRPPRSSMMDDRRNC